MKAFRREVETTATAEQVYGVLTAESWPALLAEHLSDGCELVRREVAEDGTVTLVMSRALPAGVPGFLQKFLPSEPRVVTTDVWSPLADGRASCTWSAEIVGTPARITGTQTIDGTAAGNRHVTTGEVRVPVPLLGGKAEGFIAEQAGRTADDEARVVKAVLQA